MYCSSARGVTQAVDVQSLLWRPCACVSMDGNRLHGSFQGATEDAVSVARIPWRCPVASAPHRARSFDRAIETEGCVKQSPAPRMGQANYMCLSQITDIRFWPLIVAS
jgi:hypothetical protein